MSDPRFIDKPERDSMRNIIRADAETVARLLDHAEAMDEIVAKLEKDQRIAMKIGTEDMEAITAEVGGLRAIVNRLPHTADGVPITPGMQLFNSDYPNAVDTFANGIVGSSTVRPTVPIIYGNLYSTRSAAESALASTGVEKGNEHVGSSHDRRETSSGGFQCQLLRTQRGRASRGPLAQ